MFICTRPSTAHVSSTPSKFARYPKREIVSSFVFFRIVRRKRILADSTLSAFSNLPQLLFFFFFFPILALVQSSSSFKIVSVLLVSPGNFERNFSRTVRPVVSRPKRLSSIVARDIHPLADADNLPSFSPPIVRCCSFFNRDQNREVCTRWKYSFLDTKSNYRRRTVKFLPRSRKIVFLSQIRPRQRRRYLPFPKGRASTSLWISLSSPISIEVPSFSVRSARFFLEIILDVPRKSLLDDILEKPVSRGASSVCRFLWRSYRPCWPIRISSRW